MILKIVHCGVITLHVFLISTQNYAQHISDFLSLAPGSQDAELHLPETHTFQYIIEQGDPLSVGGTMPDKADFSGYVPITNSSENGYLSINSEDTPGGVTVLDIYLDQIQKKWITTASEAIDFTSVAGTSRNCSGAATPWGNILSCEEAINTNDSNNDGYYDIGWVVEINPATKQVIGKHWGLGNMKHENVCILPDQRVFYQGADSNPGYLFKYVTINAANLGSGELLVYKGNKTSGGDWVSLGLFDPPGTGFDPNMTMTDASDAGATVFNGIEDVEYNPIDGKIYFAVKGESTTYRFSDPNPITNITVSNFETYVGGVGVSYTISHSGGTSNEPWGYGNDNLAFDDLGNLWVNQDGDNNYLWVVENGHTQSNPKVKIFGRTPYKSESTGITFTPDFKYMFMSIQHPDISNSSSGQTDAFNLDRYFDKDVTIVIALDKNLGGCHENILVLDTPDDPIGRYHAIQRIESNTTINYSGVEYRAGDKIRLDQGFKVMPTNIFKAIPDPCN